MIQQYGASDFPFDLSKELGQIVTANEEIPGVFYVSIMKNEEFNLPQEYYLVSPDASAISIEARNYGKPLSTCPGIRAYCLEDPKSGYLIIQYEISSYKLKQGLNILESESPLQISRHAMEYQPEYFGDYPAPIETPWGQTVRYKKLSTGIYWIETETLTECLAICYPVWEGDLTESTQNLGQCTGCNKDITLKNSKGYVFYTSENSCLPIFELQQDLDCLAQYIDYPALMNAIWVYQPTYAIAWNARIQSYSIGEKESKNIAAADRILKLTQELGTKFLKI